MRDYTGIHYSALPETDAADFTPRMRTMLGTIDYYLRDISAGMGRIQKGESPSGSGASIGVTDHGALSGLGDDDHGQYFKLLGRVGGQVAYGDTADSGSLTLSSSSSATKGSILLGEAGTSSFEETSELLGIAVTPAARVHAAGRLAFAPAVPTGDTALGSTPWGKYGGSGGGASPFSTYYENVNTIDDYTSYIAAQSGTGRQMVFTTSVTMATTYASWTVTYRARRLFGTALGSGSTLVLAITLNNGQQYTTGNFNCEFLGDSWVTYTAVLDTSGPGSASPDAANSIRIEGFCSAVGAYIAVTYLDAVPTGLASGYEAGRFESDAAGGGSEIVTIRGVAAQSGNLLSFYDDSVLKAYFRNDGKLRLEHPAETATHALIEAKNIADAGTGNVADFIQCYDDGDLSVFSIDSLGAVRATNFLVADVAGASGFFSGFVTDVLTADRSLTLPDADGTVIVDPGGALAPPWNLELSTTANFRSNTASAGASFRDNTTGSKRLRMVLSGAVGNNSFTLTNSAARNYGFGNLSGNVPIVGDDPPAVAAGALGKVDLTGQTAAISSTNLSSTPPAGLYVVEVYAACTTASGSGAPTLDVNIAWTDVVGATNRNVTAEAGSTAFPLSLAATGRASARLLVQVSSGNIAYTTTINAASGSPQYALYIRVVALG